MASLRGILTLSVLTLVLLSTAAWATPETPGPSEDDCAVPCGKVYASIRFELPLADPIDMSTADALPPEVPVTVYYEWDFERDGTGVPGDTDPMEIDLSVTRSPDWLTATFDDPPCQFFLNPTTPSHKACTVPLSLQVDPSLMPADEDAHDEAGKRLWLFGQSRASGNFMASYGIETLDFDWDSAPASAPAPKVEAKMPAPGVAPLAALLGAAAVAARRLQHR